MCDVEASSMSQTLRLGFLVKYKTQTQWNYQQEQQSHFRGVFNEGQGEDVFLKCFNGEQKQLLMLLNKNITKKHNTDFLNHIRREQ